MGCHVQHFTIVLCICTCKTCKYIALWKSNGLQIMQTLFQCNQADLLLKDIYICAFTYSRSTWAVHHRANNICSIQWQVNSTFILLFQNASLWFAGAFHTGRRIGLVWSRFCSILGWRRALRTLDICKRKAILSQAFKSWRTLDSIQNFQTHCFAFTLDFLNSSCWLLDSSLFIFLFGFIWTWDLCF